MAEWSTVSISGLGHAQRIEAEYYRPQYLEIAARLRAANSTPLVRFLAYLTDGTHVTPKYVAQGVPFLSSSDIDSFVISQTIEKFISQAEHAGLRHCQPQAGDILMSKSGRIGSCAVVPASIKKGDWNIYEGVALLRIVGLDPNYAAAFLNSRYGYSQIRRELKGVAQPHLHLEDIRRLFIFVPSDEQAAGIAEAVAIGVERSKQSHELYLQAQQLLESELGLDKLTFRRPVGYTARFSDVETSRRLDPEHYYPAFEAFANDLPPSISLSPLNRHLTFCQRGKQPIYADTGLRVINSKHVQPNRVLLEDNRFAAANPDGNLQIRHGDTLLNGTGRGTLGRAAPYLVDEPAVPDNHVTILRSDDLDPVYLSLYLNSAAGQMQVEMHQRGTSGQLELYPFDIRKFLIWNAPESLQQELRRFHDQAAAAERESKQLLEQAKAHVEQLIEAAARAS